MEFEKGDKVTPVLGVPSSFSPFHALREYIKENRVIGTVKRVNNDTVIVDFGKRLNNKFTFLTMRNFRVKEEGIKKVENNIRRVN